MAFDLLFKHNTVFSLQIHLNLIVLSLIIAGVLVKFVFRLKLWHEWLFTI